VQRYSAEIADSHPALVSGHSYKPFYLGSGSLARYMFKTEH